LKVGWRDSLSGHLSAPAIGMWLAMAVLAMLALGWSLAESGKR